MIYLQHFGGRDPKNGAYNPEIQTRPRLLYSVTTNQVSSPYVYHSEVIMLTNKQTNRFFQKHQPRTDIDR